MNNADQQKKTLWVGNIEPWMHEEYVSTLFLSIAKPTSVKLMRDKVTNIPLGYGFAEFESAELASEIFHKYNGTMNPTTGKPFRLNWGVFKASNNKRASSQKKEKELHSVKLINQVDLCRRSRHHGNKGTTNGAL